jgi:O-antigen/teichoic acid export membrane protein
VDITVVTKLSAFMRVLVQRISSSPNYAKALEWGKLVTITGGTQVIVQLTGFISGILIIRLLSTQEYALYTLANTMLGTMVVLADSGIANGVMAESGKVWKDREKLGIVLITGLNLRKKFGIVSLAVTLPILAYLLQAHGANWITVILILLAIIPAFFATLSDSLLEIIPRLYQEIKPLQKNEAEVSLSRLIISSLFLFIFPYTFIALIANGIPRIYGNYKLRKISARFVNSKGETDDIVQKAIVRSVKQALPIAVYYCLSGQISIWLISFLGTTSSISQIGALGRLAVVFNLFSSLFTTLVVPRFSRMATARNILLKPFLLIQVSTMLIGATVLLLTWLFSNQILITLGSKYQGLNYELLLMTIANCIGLLAGVCSQLVLSRGWFLNPYFLIVLNLFTTIASLMFFNTSSLIGVFYFNIFVACINYFLVLIYGLIKIHRSKISLSEAALE